jgi:cardiolipin synthase A/B
VTSYELHVGAPAFWRRAAGDIAAARRRVLVQAMTFEGDAAGLAAADAIASSGAADRRVLVDAYSRAVISDRWVAGPRKRLAPELRAEVEATCTMFADLRRRGVGVRVTNPFGSLMANYPARNHKKLIVADDIAWLGGVNFSDHNFAWADFMLRLDGPEAAEVLAQDFEATWTGAPRAARADIGELTLVSLDGRTNDRFFADYDAMIARARREILVMSAYLTFPFTKPLAAAARRGVAVTLITPGPSNKPTVRDDLLRFARRAGLDVRLTPEMSHAKGLMIDGETLVVGSCNFDFASVAAEEELVAIVRAPEVIAAFRGEVVEPSLAGASTPGAAAPWAGLGAHAALKLAELFARSARGARRTAVDWT